MVNLKQELMDQRFEYCLHCRCLKLTNIHLTRRIANFMKKIYITDSHLVRGITTTYMIHEENNHAYRT